MGALIAGIIVAAVSATVSTIDYLIDSGNQKDEINAQREYQQQQYENSVELLNLEFEQAKEDAEQNAERAEQNADVSDKKLDVSEKTLSDGFNAEIDNLQAQQEQNILDWNIYAITADKATGESMSNLGASGVRAGSTMAESIELDSALNSQQLQMQQDITRQNQNYQLKNAINGFNMDAINIGVGRTEADWMREDAAYLRNSFLENGDNWNIYQNKLKTQKTTFDNNMGQLDREYDKVSGWNRFWGATSRLMGGAAAGYQTGYKIGSTFQEYYKGK